MSSHSEKNPNKEEEEGNDLNEKYIGILAKISDHWLQLNHWKRFFKPAYIKRYISNLTLYLILAAAATGATFAVTGFNPIAMAVAAASTIALAMVSHLALWHYTKERYHDNNQEFWVYPNQETTAYKKIGNNTQAVEEPVTKRRWGFTLLMYAFVYIPNTLFRQFTPKSIERQQTLNRSVVLLALALTAAALISFYLVAEYTGAGDAARDWVHFLKDSILSHTGFFNDAINKLGLYSYAVFAGIGVASLAIMTATINLLALPFSDFNLNSRFISFRNKALKLKTSENLVEVSDVPKEGYSLYSNGQEFLESGAIYYPSNSIWEPCEKSFCRLSENTADKFEEFASKLKEKISNFEL